MTKSTKKSRKVLGRLQGRLLRGFCYLATLPDMAVGSGYDAYDMSMDSSRFEPRALASPFSRFNTGKMYAMLCVLLQLIRPQHILDRTVAFFP